MHRRNATARIGLVGLLALAVLGSLAGLSRGEPAAALPLVLHQDFRVATRLTDGLQYRHLEKPEHAHFVDGGLLLKVEKPFLIQARQGIGVETAFGLRGDFDITLTFDQFQAETPKIIPGAGNGVGVTLRVDVANRGVTGINRWRQTELDGVNWVGQHFAPTEMSAGRLRLVRRGSMVSRLWSEQIQGDDFHLLGQTNKGNDDIVAAWFEISTNAQSRDVQTRALELQIRGRKSPGLVAQTPPSRGEPPVESPPAEAPQRGSLRTVLFLGFIALALGAGICFFLGRRPARPARTAIPGPGGTSESSSGASARGADSSARRVGSPVSDRRRRALAVALLCALVAGCAVYANLAFTVEDPADFRFFPPFRPAVNANRSLTRSEWINIAFALADGKGFANQWREPTGPTAWMPPALPFLLAGVIGLCQGNRELAVILVNLLQFCTVFATGLLVLAATRRRSSNDPTWLGPLLVAGVFSVWVVNDFHHWFQRNWDHWTILVALDVLILGLAWYEPLGSRRAAMLWGSVGGLLALVSPITGFTWGVLTLAVAIRQHVWPRTALAVLLAVVVMSPWIVRNYLVFGRLIPVKSTLAYELYQAQCLQKELVLSTATLDAHHPISGRTAEGREYRRLGEMAFMDQVANAFRQSVRADPLDYCDRALDRFLCATLWYAPYNVSRPDAPRAAAIGIARLLYPLPLLAAIYLVFSSNHRPLARIQWIVLGVYGVYLAPYVLISYYERYGVPLLGVKVLLVLWAAERLFGRRAQSTVPDGDATGSQGGATP